MTFPEKSSIATIVALVAVYAGYAAVLAAARNPGDAMHDVGYEPLLVLAAVAFGIVMAVSHGVIAALAPRDANAFDERDRAISMRSEQFGGWVLAAGVFGAIVLTLVEASYFYIANALVLAWVLAEVVARASTLVLYRRPG